MVALVAGLVAATLLLAGRRDVGAGVVPARDSGPPHLTLLSGQVGLAVRLERAAWLSWAVGLAVMSYLFGIVATAVAATSSTTLLARLGAGRAGVPAYLGLFYMIVGAALALAAAGQVAAIREEEAEGHADTLLVRPVGRIRWLGGRLIVSVGALGGLAVIAGLGGWAGAASQHGGVGLLPVLGAAANMLPAALLVLGVGTLAHGLAPRWAVPVAYGLVAWSFVVEMLGATGTGGRLLLDLSVFHHVALLPAAAFRPSGAAALVALGATGMAAGAALFQRRDLTAA